MEDSHIKKMGTSRKLNQEQEREVALAYLCGVDTGYIQERYGVSDATTRSNIVGKRSREWNDPLVDFYRQIDARNKDVNSAHMFLSFQRGIKPEVTGLIDSERDQPVYEIVRSVIYTPGINGILERTALAEYATGTHPYDNFLGAIFDNRPCVENIVNNTLVSILQKTYKPGERLSLRDVFHEVGDSIIDKVRSGALAWTDIKKNLVHEVLDTLPPKEQRVMGLRFGLDGYDGPKNLNETGQDFGVSRERIRQIEGKALRRLRHPSRSKYLRVLTDLSTDADVKSYHNLVHEQQIRNGWKIELYSEIKQEILNNQVPPEIWSQSVDELEFSLRTTLCLRNLDIRTVSELASLTEMELIRSKNFGRKSLKEVKKALGELNVSLAQP